MELKLPKIKQQLIKKFSAKKIVAAIGDDANNTSALINELFPSAAYERNKDSLFEIAYKSDDYDVIHISNTNNNPLETREKAADVLYNDGTRLLIIYVDAAKNTGALIDSATYAFGIEEKVIFVVNYPESIDEHQISEDREILRRIFEKDIALYPISSYSVGLVKSSIMSKIEENMKEQPQ